MKGLKVLILGLFTALAFAPVVEAKKVREVNEFEEKAVRKCIVTWYESQLHVKELTGHNDNQVIYSYFDKIGMKNMKNVSPLARAWCGAFVANAWLSCFDKIPWVKSNAQLANVDHWRYTGKEYLVKQSEAGPGDVVALKTYRHVQGIKEVHPNPTFPFYKAIGGNTGAPSASKDKRQGVWEKNSLWREVGHIISVKKALEGIS